MHATTLWLKKILLPSALTASLASPSAFLVPVSCSISMTIRIASCCFKSRQQTKVLLPPHLAHETKLTCPHLLRLPVQWTATSI